MISRSKNFIFVHIPKTAGNSVAEVLLPHCDDRLILDPARHQDGKERFDLVLDGTDLIKHSTVDHYRRALGVRFFADATKITVVRNPWDRAISKFLFKLKRPPYLAGTPVPDPEFGTEEFLRWLRKESGYVPYLCLKRKSGDGYRPVHRHSIDVMLRFERLQDDFDALAARLKLAPVALNRRNATYHRPYAEYYSDRTAKAVRDLYAEEIEYFGYAIEHQAQPRSTVPAP